MVGGGVSAAMVAVVAVVAVVTLVASGASAKALPQQESVVSDGVFPNSQLSPHLDATGNHLIDDDGSLENALINYLYAKQFVDRLKRNMDISDLQRKRSYWKQCAFNAVSCFGKK